MYKLKHYPLNKMVCIEGLQSKVFLTYYEFTQLVVPFITASFSHHTQKGFIHSNEFEKIIVNKLEELCQSVSIDGYVYTKKKFKEIVMNRKARKFVRFMKRLRVTPVYKENGDLVYRVMFRDMFWYSYRDFQTSNEAQTEITRLINSKRIYGRIILEFNNCRYTL